MSACGGMAERLKAAVLKTAEGNTSGGSNPSPSVSQYPQSLAPLNGVAFDVLREAASCRAEGCELVFPGRWGGPRRSILGQFRKALDAAGLDPGITVHDLRHVAASATASQGVPLQVIGELLGHRTPAMTARYSHLLPSAVKAGVAEIGAFLTGEDRPKGGAKVVRLAQAAGGETDVFGGEALTR